MSSLATDNRPRVTIFAENYGERYTLDSDRRHVRSPSAAWRPPCEFMGVPDDLALEIDIFSEAPAGASTGTSAAVSVALIGALDSADARPTDSARGRPGRPPDRDGTAAPAVRRAGPVGLGLRGHQFHRDPRLSARRRQPATSSPARPVGVGRDGFRWSSWASRTVPRRCTSG